MQEHAQFEFLVYSVARKSDSNKLPWQRHGPLVLQNHWRRICRFSMRIPFLLQFGPYSKYMVTSRGKSRSKPSKSSREREYEYIAQLDLTSENEGRLVLALSGGRGAVVAREM
ncbi:hypothetical protein J6590_041549 [Homalodisca vitripennis]|nr:hypothetical protein J6590_041549 [Homalodisca vitripennis]